MFKRKRLGNVTFLNLRILSDHFASLVPNIHIPETFAVCLVTSITIRHLHDKWYHFTLHRIKTTKQKWHHTSFMHYQLGGNCAPVIQDRHTAFQTLEDRHISLKWRTTSKRTSLLGRVSFHWPGMHSGWNVGRSLWYGGGGFRGNKNGGQRQRCDLARAPQGRIRNSVLPAKHMWAWHWNLELHLARWPNLDQAHCSCSSELSI